MTCFILHLNEGFQIINYRTPDNPLKTLHVTNIRNMRLQQEAYVLDIFVVDGCKHRMPPMCGELTSCEKLIEKVSKIPQIIGNNCVRRLDCSPRDHNFKFTKPKICSSL